jgi:hypothetical protein
MIVKEGLFGGETTGRRGEKEGEYTHMKIA